MPKIYGHTRTLFIQNGKYKWSYKYEHCISCGGVKSKHKGNGLCTSCFDRERVKKSEKRRINIKKQKLIHYFKFRIKLFLTKTEKQKSGPKKTNFDKKIYYRRFYEKNKEVLNLIQKTNRLIKNGFSCMKININGQIKYLPFSTLEKPLGTTNNMSLYDEWKEKIRQYDLLINYRNKKKI